MQPKHTPVRAARCRICAHLCSDENQCKKSGGALMNTHMRSPREKAANNYPRAQAKKPKHIPKRVAVTANSPPLCSLNILISSNQCESQIGRDTLLMLRLG
jgi:hypothetical protein